MPINQYALYRVDLSTLGRKLWKHSYEYVQKNHLQVRSEYYKQQSIAFMDENDTAMKLWNQNRDRIEVSDVMVINKDGEVSAYYVGKEHLSPVAGFIRINTSGALITMDTKDYHINNYNGNWLATDYIIIDGKQYFLLENSEYRDKIPAVILDAYGKIVVEQVKNGFDEQTKQRLRAHIRELASQSQTVVKQQKQRLEIWQKYYQNGEWLRSAESGGEANYDMVDGRVNNLPQETKAKPVTKHKRRESVIHKLHKKQIEIAIRSGKPIPKYLEQNRELNK